MSQLKFTDINIRVGSVDLIKNGTISVCTNQKYALVGQNGVGKTYLCDMISNRTPPFEIDPSIRIHYVKQEVDGDERTALQTLLETDSEREYLLKNDC